MTMFKICCSLFIHLTFVSSIVDGYGKEDVKKLKIKLFDIGKYDKSIRPIAYQTRAVKVRVFFSLLSIIDLDMDNGRFDVSGSYLARWFDDGLAWNQSEHAGITRLELETDSIWNPKLTQINTVGDHFRVSSVVVERSGLVTWTTTGEFRSFCHLNMRYFPRDKHICDISIMSASYGISYVTLKPITNRVDTKNMQYNGKWHVGKTNVKYVEFNNSHRKMAYSTIVNSIYIKRRPKFELLHRGFPIVLFVLANLFVHVIPLLSGEKISFSITLLLALVFWQATIVDDLPKNSSQLSLVSIIMTLAMAQSTMTVIFSVFLCRLANEQDRPIPKFLKKIAWRRRQRKRNIQSSNDALNMETRKRNEKALPATKTISIDETEKPNEDMHTTTEDSNTIEVVWLDVANTLDVAVGVINVIGLLVVCIVFGIIFSN